MKLPLGLRKYTLIAHIACSVGWLGAVIPYLALAIFGLGSRDSQMVRAAYLAMEVIGWYVIVPLSFAAFLSGLIQSLATSWGLFRHWWIVAKLLLTAIAVLVLLHHMQAVSSMSRMAATSVLTSDDVHLLRVQLVVHSAGGLLVLLVVTALSVIKPWGLTPYGQRNATLPAVPPAMPRAVAVVRSRFPLSSDGTPFWLRVVGFHVLGLSLLLVVFLHLTGGGMRGH